MEGSKIGYSKLIYRSSENKYLTLIDLDHYLVFVLSL